MIRLTCLYSLLLFFFIFSTMGCGPDCDQLEEDARRLASEYSRCSEDGACQVVDLYYLAGPNNCFSVFQCSGAFNADANLGDFAAKARSLAKDYSTCDKCSFSLCLPPSTYKAECNIEKGICEIFER